MILIARTASAGLVAVKLVIAPAVEESGIPLIWTFDSLEFINLIPCLTSQSPEFLRL
jgi:hypothetical protein